MCAWLRCLGQGTTFVNSDSDNDLHACGDKAAVHVSNRVSDSGLFVVVLCLMEVGRFFEVLRI